MIEHLTENDIGRWIVYRRDLDYEELSRIKGFNNEDKRAFVVYKANGLLHSREEWKGYTGQSTRYGDLEFEEVKNEK